MEPTTLQEAITHFADADNCVAYMVKKRWPMGVTCPTCGNVRVTFDAKSRRWQCSSHHPKRKFSLKTGTILEDSPLGLDKWLPVIWLVTNCKNGVSSWEIHRAMGVTQKTAWFMLQRARLALQGKNAGKLSGAHRRPGQIPRPPEARRSQNSAISISRQINPLPTHPASTAAPPCYPSNRG
jgi:transposase-like protein